MVIVTVLFTMVFLAVTIDLAQLILSIKTQYRFWPSPHGWKRIYGMILTLLWVPGFFILSILDWGSLNISDSIFGYGSFGVGAGILAAGIYINVSATRDLGSGYIKEGELVTTGWYSYTRNPQYIGNLLLGLGAIITFNTLLGLIVGIPATLWFLLAPYAEEPVLHEMHGEAYTEYCRRTPRWF